MLTLRAAPLPSGRKPWLEGWNTVETNNGIPFIDWHGRQTVELQIFKLTFRTIRLMRRPPLSTYENGQTANIHQQWMDNIFAITCNILFGCCCHILHSACWIYDCKYLLQGSSTDGSRASWGVEPDSCGAHQVPRWSCQVSSPSSSSSSPASSRWWWWWWWWWCRRGADILHSVKAAGFSSDPDRLQVICNHHHHHRHHHHGDEDDEDGDEDD